LAHSRNSRVELQAPSCRGEGAIPSGCAQNCTRSLQLKEAIFQAKRILEMEPQGFPGGLMKVAGKNNSSSLFGRIRNQQGKLGWVLLWALGIPIPVLLVLFLLRGCT